MKNSDVIHMMNLFQLVLTLEGFSLVLDSSESLLNIEAELSENLANASSKVGRMSSGSEGSEICCSAGTKRVLSESTMT